MKTLLILAAVVAVSAGLAFAQGGSIGIYSEPTGTTCDDIVDHGPGLMSIYLVHTLHGGATAIRFSAPKPPCFSALWLYDTPVFPTTAGNSQTGVTIDYGTCLPAPVHVLTMTFFSQWATPNCCPYEVLPDLNLPSGRIEAVDCASHVMYPTGHWDVINPTPACGRCVLPAEDTTWGRVKAMFVE